MRIPRIFPRRPTAHFQSVMKHTRERDWEGRIIRPRNLEGSHPRASNQPKKPSDKQQSARPRGNPSRGSTPADCLAYPLSSACPLCTCVCTPYSPTTPYATLRPGLCTICMYRVCVCVFSPGWMDDGTEGRVCLKLVVSPSQGTPILWSSCCTPERF
jgi:hypothetical protein